MATFSHDNDKILIVSLIDPEYDEMVHLFFKHIDYSYFSFIREWEGISLDQKNFAVQLPNMEGITLFKATNILHDVNEKEVSGVFIIPTQQDFKDFGIKNKEDLMKSVLDSLETEWIEKGRSIVDSIKWNNEVSYEP